MRLCRFVPTFEVKKLMLGTNFVNKMHNSAAMTIISARNAAGFLNDWTCQGLCPTVSQPWFTVPTEHFCDMLQALQDGVF